MTQHDFDRSRRRVLKAIAGGAAAAGTLGFTALVRAQQDTHCVLYTSDAADE
jgi:hypothetical protein